MLKDIFFPHGKLTKTGRVYDDSAHIYIRAPGNLVLATRQIKLKEQLNFSRTPQFLIDKHGLSKALTPEILTYDLKHKELTNGNPELVQIRYSVTLVSHAKDELKRFQSGHTLLINPAQFKLTHFYRFIWLIAVDLELNSQIEDNLHGLTKNENDIQNEIIEGGEPL